jgi:mannosyltransferase
MTGDEPAEGESPPMPADCAEGACRRTDGSCTVVRGPQAGSLCYGGIDRPFLLGLVLVMLVAAWLRGVQMNESLWLDELHTAWTVYDDWREIPWRAEIGNQSPLYFYGVALTTRIGGLSEVTLRLPSALAGVALVGLAGWLVASWTGLRIAGLLTALLVALDHTSVFYAQEARPYAWVQLLGLVHVAAFVLLLARPRLRWRALWIGSAIALYYLHYTALLLLVAEVVAYGVLWAIGAFPKAGQALGIHDPEPVPFSERWKPVYRLRQFAADLSLVALGMLPSIPHVAQIAARRDAWSMFIGNDPAPARIFSLFPLDIYLLLPAGIGIAAWAWRLKKGTGVVFAQTACRPGRFPHENDSRPLFPMVAAVCWLFVPVMLAWTLTVADVARLFFLRYLVVSAIAPAVLTGLMLRLYPGRLSRVAGSVAVVVALAWHSGLVQQYALDGRVIGDRRQDWRGAVTLLQQRAVGENAPVFVRSGLIEADRLRDDDSPQLHQYCLLPVRGIYRLDLPPEDLLPLPTSRSSELTTPQISRIAAAGQAFFLLVGSPRSIARLQRQLADSLTAHGLAMIPTEQHTFGDVAVLHYVIHDRADPKPNESL